MEWITPAVTAACAVSGLINAWFVKDNRNLKEVLTAQIDAAVANLKNEIGKARGADKEELKDWINGSFMRTKVVEAEMNAYEIRLDHIEKRLDP